MNVLDNLREHSNILTEWEDEIAFGKYEGSTVREIFETDPSYLEWLIDKTKRTDFSSVMEDEICAAAAEQDAANPSGWDRY